MGVFRCLALSLSEVGTHFGLDDEIYCMEVVVQFNLEADFQILKILESGVQIKLDTDFQKFGGRRPNQIGRRISVKVEVGA